MSIKVKVVALLMTISLGAAIVSGCTSTTEAREIQEESYIPVAIETASTSTIENNTRLNGKVYANEELMVIPKTVGVVTSVNVKLGDYVQEGSILFTIEQKDILKSVEQAANGVELARKGVDQAENAVNNANINYELNKEQAENAALNLERTRKLYEAGAVSKSQLEQAELAASEKGLEAVKGQISQAEIGYQQALNQLRQAEISQEQALSSLDNTVVKAPISGVISELNVKEGQIVSNSQPSATIVNSDKVYIQVNVVENIVNRLRLGQEVNVNVPAAINEDITSTISYISPTADIRSQLYPVKIYIDNKDKNIRPGMNGEINLGLDKVESTIVIPANAVLDKNGVRVVYIVEDNIAVEKIVTTGLDTGDYVEIKEGIEEGDNVIVEGQHYLENNAKVKVVRGE